MMVAHRIVPIGNGKSLNRGMDLRERAGILNEIIMSHSDDTSQVFISLPRPPANGNDDDCGVYVPLIDTFSLALALALALAFTCLLIIVELPSVLFLIQRTDSYLGTARRIVIRYVEALRTLTDTLPPTALTLNGEHVSFVSSGI